MDVRTFEAFSMKEAVKSVKQALGSDAVILSTHERVGPGGKGKIIEVTAAAAGRKGAGSAAPSKEGAGLPIEPASEPIVKRLEALSARVTLLAHDAATNTQVQSLEAGMRELKLLLIEVLRSKPGSSLIDLPEVLIPIERQLRVMGIDDVSLADLMRHLRALPRETGDHADHAQTDRYKDQALRWMMKKIRIAPRWNIVPGTVSWQAVVGPPGAGKSTVVAKLAAHYVMKEKIRVAVVSLDDKRLAAAEQMRVFCRIIDVPFDAVADANELAATNRRREGKVDLIIVDTPGLSAKDASAVATLGAMRSQDLTVDCHLCLSITEKEQQLEAAIRAFSPLGLSSLIFSRLDDSWSYGEIYNLSRRWQLPLAFFGTGPRIPDDFERATRERVVERLFGL